jgi:hypothetical protein
VLLKVNSALKKANFSQFSRHVEHHIMVLALLMEYAVIGRWEPRFRRLSSPHPAPSPLVVLGGSQAPNRDEKHSD